MKSFFFVVIASMALMACTRSSSDKKIHSIDENIDKLTPHDINLGKPESNDWLNEHLEPGQTFEQYIKGKPVSPNKKQNKIYLQPIGTLTAIDKNIIAHTSDYLSVFFELETVVLPSIEESFIPKSARRMREEGHEQFLTGFILNHLQTKMPEDAIVIMAITSKDLYPAENWNFVFGQARTRNRVGVSSFYRYMPDSLDSPGYALCLERLIKTSSHEISHMFTCQHCTYAICIMNGSNSLRETDSQPNHLCTNCLRKLQWNLGFKVKPHLNRLKEYFAIHKLTRDYDMVVSDLKLLPE